MRNTQSHNKNNDLRPHNHPTAEANKDNTKTNNKVLKKNNGIAPQRRASSMKYKSGTEDIHSARQSTAHGKRRGSRAEENCGWRRGPQADRRGRRCLHSCVNMAWARVCLLAAADARVRDNPLDQQSESIKASKTQEEIKNKTRRGFG